MVNLISLNKAYIHTKSEGDDSQLDIYNIVHVYSYSITLLCITFQWDISVIYNGTKRQSNKHTTVDLHCNKHNQYTGFILFP